MSIQSARKKWRADGGGAEPIGLTGSPQPAVSHNRLVVSPLAGELKVFGCTEDIEAFVGPDLAIAGDGDHFGVTGALMFCTCSSRVWD